MASENPLSQVPGIEWPAFAPPAGASMLAMQWQLEQSQWWPGELLLEQQFRQIRALVAHAVAHVPHYRGALRATGCSRVEQLDAEAFRRWPILRKEEARRHAAALRAAGTPREHGRLLENYTTGSTGTPLRVFHTEAAQFFTHALIIRDHLLHQRDFSRKFGAIRRDAGEAVQREGWGMADAMFATGPACAISSFTDVDELLDWLQRERPAYLLVYPSVLRALIVRGRERGLAPSGLRGLMTQSEMLPEDLRELARADWGVVLTDNYSCNEVGSIASQCPDHEHYLVHAENVYVEILRDDGAPCARGETGRVVLTPLHNFAMPLIRYELGDCAEAGDACASGRGLPVLNRIAGRVRNMLRDPLGRTRWPSFTTTWELVPQIRQARLVQRSLSALEAQLVSDRELTGDERARLAETLRTRLGYPFEITFVRVERIERAREGKFEEFLSLLPEDPSPPTLDAR